MSLELPWKQRLTPGYRRQEGDLQKRGGVTHPASGRIWRFKRDGKLFDFLIEARTTESNRYCIDYDEWKAISKEAAQTPPGLMPGMQIDIKDQRLMVIDLLVFEEIYHKLIAMSEALEGE